MSSLFMVAVPEAKDNQEFSRIVKCLRGTKCSMFHIPALRVGTLDELMTLGDELPKVDMIGEATAKKIRRTFEELKVRMEREDLELTIDDQDPRDYVETFAWADQRYPSGRKLPELVSMIQSSMHTVDEAMKNLISEYTDSRNKVAALQRKNSGNLMSADINDVLTLDKTGGRALKDIFWESEFMKTVAIVVPTNARKSFEESYEALDSGAVALFKESKIDIGLLSQGADSAQFSLTTPADRTLMVELSYSAGRDFPSIAQLKLACAAQHNVPAEMLQISFDGDILDDDTPCCNDQIPAGAALGLDFSSPLPVRQVDTKMSPVVPGSAEFLSEDNEGYAMYSVSVLRGAKDSNLDSLKRICVEKRWSLREWTPPTYSADGSTDSLKAQLEKAEKANLRHSKSLLKWCPNWFNNVYVAWLHIKSIRVFVESVLRWGVPPNFSAALVEAKNGKDAKKITEALREQYRHLDAVGCGELAKDSSAAVTAMLAGDGEYHPYVFLNIDCF